MTDDPDLQGLASITMGHAAFRLMWRGKDSEDSPLSAALGSPHFPAIATGQGMLHSPHEYARCLNGAGLLQTQSLGLRRDHGVWTAIK